MDGLEDLFQMVGLIHGKESSPEDLVKMEYRRFERRRVRLIIDIGFWNDLVDSATRDVLIARERVGGMTAPLLLLMSKYRDNKDVYHDVQEAYYSIMGDYTDFVMGERKTITDFESQHFNMPQDELAKQLLDLPWMFHDSTFVDVRHEVIRSDV